jgi:purine-binding chemotaxis protein CheW
MVPSSEAATTQVLVFEVGGRRFGLLAAAVREVVRAVEVVQLPKAPAVVEGVINVRGNVVPVLDVRSRFRLPPKPLEPADHLIVAKAGSRVVALRVDRATDLVRLDPADVEEARGIVPGAEYLTWVAKLPHELVLIHDLETFLSRAESAALAEALPKSAAEGG